jgi:Fur family transcriptional regulator, ferric uptake regulator
MGTVLILKHRSYDARVGKASGQRAEWAEHAREELRRAGHRTGGARAAVLDLVAQQTCCLTAQQIFDRLRADGRDVGIASVYRALELLTRMSLLRRVELADAAGYEPALPGGEHHHHVVCDRCGRVSTFEDERLEQAIERLAGRLKFDVAGHDVVLHGHCPDCRSSAG